MTRPLLKVALALRSREKKETYPFLGATAEKSILVQAITVGVSFSMFDDITSPTH